MIDKSKNPWENLKNSLPHPELNLLNLHPYQIRKDNQDTDKTRQAAQVKPVKLEHQTHHTENATRHLHGIDVSANNGNINWKKVKHSHIDFAFIKATEGGTFKDRAFSRNWHGASAAGIHHGAYHFFRPDKSIKTQIHNFVQTVKQLKAGDLPPVLDVEEPQRWSKLSHKESADKVLTWLKGVKKELGTTPIIYMSSSFAQDILGGDKRLAHYPLWLAHYTKHSPDIPEPYQRHTFWQYTEEGKIAGISGSVDRNYFNGSKKQLLKLGKA